MTTDLTAKKIDTAQQYANTWLELLVVIDRLASLKRAADACGTFSNADFANSAMAYLDVADFNAAITYGGQDFVTAMNTGGNTMAGGIRAIVERCVKTRSF